MKHYNYIFTGVGLSTLMTIYEMVVSQKFSNTSILLIDADAKKANDRTWCFWENETFHYENIITKKWTYALFANQDFSVNLNLKPYHYKMIKGIDFYNYIFKIIQTQQNIDFLQDKVIHYTDLKNHCQVTTSQHIFNCDKIFNTIFDPGIITSQSKYPLLQQHFIGWFIKSKENVFNADILNFMDFSVAQKGNTRFMYVLPLASNEALIEYTLFSKDLLNTHEYENEIKQYIKKLGITQYEILEKEQGNIPMTCYKFWQHNTKNLIHIGSAGGWTKASTGFTFKNVTKKAKALTHFLTQQDDFRQFYKKDKFWFYDLLFIDVLYKQNELGIKVFSSLFKNGQSLLTLKFLDGETTFIEDLKVMLKCPTLPFVKAFVNRVLKK